MERARDISPQTLRLNWDGELRELKFNNRAMSVAEDVYDEQYNKKDCSWVAILSDLTKGKSNAIMAVYYGALKGAFKDLTYEEFEDKFKLTDIPEVAEQLAKAVKDSLPEAKEGPAKNA